MDREERLAQTGDCPSEYPDNCPDLTTCPVHDDGTLFPDRDCGHPAGRWCACKKQVSK